MAIKPILRYPHPGLSHICAPVTVFDDSLRVLAQDLTETMRAAPGVGITAAHIGVDQRLFVLELSGPDSVNAYVNPEIIERSQTHMRHTEGSVSMPGATEEVERPDAVVVRYQTLDGTVKEERAEGFLAVCIQHEIDQLDGIFWLNRLSKLKRDRLTTKWKKLQH